MFLKNGEKQMKDFVTLSTPDMAIISERVNSDEIIITIRMTRKSQLKMPPKVPLSLLEDLKKVFTEFCIRKEG
jgi:hypothetical protein